MKTKGRLAALTPYMLMAPALLAMGFASVYPVLFSVKLSFFDWQLGTQWANRTFVGIENYVKLFTEPAVYTSLWVTVVFAVAVVSAELVLGTLLAFLVEKGIRGLAVFRTLLMLPMMVAPVVVGLIWRYLYDSQFGLINYFMQAVGLKPLLWLADPNLALPSIIIADIWQWTPFIFILVLAGLQSLPASVMEAARVDGAGLYHVIRHIKLPLLLPVMSVALLLRLIDAFRVLEVIFIMTFGGPGLETEILSLHVYKTAFLSQRLGLASAIANFLLFVILAFSVILLVVTKPTKAAK
jgi:multiple sugar transport system permease protein